MRLRTTKTKCPNCNKVDLRAIEVVAGNVSGYDCVSCGAKFDAEVFHDWDNKKHYWLGRLRNSRFWQLDNRTIQEGLAEMENREKQGIKPYLSTHIIEEIVKPQTLRRHNE